MSSVGRAYDVQGKGVFLTGGAKGIGKCILDTVLDKGARVVFCDVNEDKGKATERQLRDRFQTNDVTFLQCDISNDQQFKEVWQKAVTILGGVDVCVNNAGMLHEGLWEKCVQVNVVGTMRGCMLAYHHMRKDKGGKGGVIINMASNAGIRYNLHQAPAYGATKHAVVGYTCNWACDPGMTSRGVRWGAVCPEGVLTEMTTHITMEQINLPDLNEGPHTNHEYQLPEDVAAALMTLLEDDASNGHVIRVYMHQGQIIRDVMAVDRNDNLALSGLVQISHTVVPPCQRQQAISSL